MKEETFNKWFNAFILLGMAAALIITTAFKLGGTQTGKALLMISAFGSLMGILSSVFSANASIWTFFFGLLNVSIYSVMCFINWKQGGSGLGNAILHMLYSAPMQFVGIWQWKRRGRNSSDKLKARRLYTKQRGLSAALFIVSSIAAYLVLAKFDRSAADSFIKIAIVFDALTLICNIFGQFLMSTAYMEQWVFWIGVNVFSIAMWSVSLKSGDSSFAIIYVIKYSFYLINSINGLRIWLNISKPEAGLQK